MGSSADNSDLITRVAGVSEMIFGLLLIVLYKNRIIHLLSIFALLGLLVYVIFMIPALLVEAFNPVTTNLPLIALSLFLLNNNKSQGELR